MRRATRSLSLLSGGSSSRPWSPSLFMRGTSEESEGARLCFSTDGGDGSRVKIFDRDLKRKQRDRAAWLMRPGDCFIDSVAENLLDRLQDCKKTFPTALCLGGSLEAVRRLIRGRVLWEIEDEWWLYLMPLWI